MEKCNLFIILVIKFKKIFLKNIIKEVKINVNILVYAKIFYIVIIVFEYMSISVSNT